MFPCTPMRYDVLLAQFKAAEAAQYNFLASLSNRFVDKITNHHRIVLHPRLHHQYLLTQGLFELVTNDLFTPCLRNTRHGGVFLDSFACLCNDVFWYISIVDIF